MRDKTLMPYIVAVFYAVLISAAVLLGLVDKITGGLASDFISTRTPAFGLTLLCLAGSVVALQIVYSHFGPPSWMTEDD